jgi:selenide, water dikinase
MDAGAELVLVGGGHSHALVLAQLAKQALPAGRVMLISKDAMTPYSGMLPGVVAGHYTVKDAHIDLRSLCAKAGVQFIHDAVVALDVRSQTLVLAGGARVNYQVLSVNIGSTPDMSAPGAQDHAVAVKPISNFLARWEALVSRITESTTAVSIAVVGAGAGGTEMALAMRQGLRLRLQSKPQRFAQLSFHLFAASEQILPEHTPGVRQVFARLCQEQGITVHLNARVTRVKSHCIEVESGATHAIDEVLWVTSASAQDWVTQCGVATDDNGFLLVDRTLQSVSHPGIFASGDCAIISGHPRAKAGVFAVRQGPPLDHNLRAKLAAEALIPHTPQADYLALIGTGARYAVVSKRGFWPLRGRWVWFWKDWIDRRFMRQFR